jgi:hypothetical protein
MIAIKVGAQHTQRRAARFRETRRHGDIFKTAIPILEKSRDEARETMRAAKFRRASGIGAFLRGIVIEIIRDHQIEPAIAIEIEKCCRTGPTWIVQALALAEFATTAIHKQSD